MVLQARTCPTCGVVTLSDPAHQPSGAGGRSDRPRCGNCTTLLGAVAVRMVELHPAPATHPGGIEAGQ